MFFSVYEPHKNITEPRLSDVLLDPGVVNLPSLDDICKKVLSPLQSTRTYHGGLDSFPLLWLLERGSRNNRTFWLSTQLAPPISMSLALMARAPVYDVYFDNFRIVGSQQQCELGRVRLRDAFTKESLLILIFGILRVRLSGNPFHAQVVRGRDHKRIRDKVQVACCFPRTLRDLLSTVGSLIFAGRVLGLSLAKGFPIFKFMRCRSSFALDAKS